MGFRSTGFLGENESCANPDSACSEHKSGSHGLTIEQTTGRHDLNILTRQWAFLSLAHLRYGRNQDSSRHITCVTTSLTALSANHIGANVEAFLDMLRVTDHVHVKDASFVEALHDGRWRDANGTDKKLGPGFNNYGHEFVEFALCVVITGLPEGHSQQQSDH